MPFIPHTDADVRTMLDAIFSPKVRKKTRRAKQRESLAPADAELASRRETESPKSTREPELAPARISLVGDPEALAARGRRTPSDPPPAPLRASAAGTPPAPSATTTPIRTPPGMEKLRTPEGEKSES